jgi:hypothetical protein
MGSFHRRLIEKGVMVSSANHDDESPLDVYPSKKGTLIMSYVTRYFWAGILLASLIASPAQAGGLYLYELGTPDVGTAAAGWAARAQDAEPSLPIRRG